MKTVNPPTADTPSHRHELRTTLLNAKRSSFLSLVFLLLPLLFLSGVVFKHYLHLNFGLLTSVYDWITSYDQQYGDTSVLNWVIRLLLTLGPLLAVGLSLLGILHVSYSKEIRELTFSLKIRWFNLTIVLIGLFIFATFFLYLVAENAG